jgi:ribulose-5-phosphate 4-epimerase/fuculose-1-phosphate aldolase
MTKEDDLRREVALANRILAREGVVDAYGHVSCRHPDRPDRFLLSRSRSPELVVPADLMEFGLDGEAAGPAEQRKPYLERYIHAAIYEARPEVNSVVHNHSSAVLPFSVTGTPLRPLIHTAGLIGATVPTWDIRERFGDTNMLVANLEQGRDLARALGPHSVVLMRGHGCSVAAEGLQEAVIAAVYAQLNATLQMNAAQLGEVKFLSDGEIRETGALVRVPAVLARVWEYLASRADRRNL